MWPRVGAIFWAQSHNLNKLGRGAPCCYIQNIKALGKIFKFSSWKYIFWLFDPVTCMQQTGAIQTITEEAV